MSDSPFKQFQPTALTFEIKQGRVLIVVKDPFFNGTKGDIGYSLGMKYEVPQFFFFFHDSMNIRYTFSAYLD